MLEDEAVELRRGYIELVMVTFTAPSGRDLTHLWSVQH